MANIIEHDGDPFRVWHIDDIYQGVQGAQSELHVPNEKDLVMDPENGFYLVASVDEQSNIPTLVNWNILAIQQQQIEDNDLPGGLSRNYLRSTNKAYADYSVSPARLTIDPYTYLYGSEAVQAKVFKGTDVSSSGVVISRTYNAAGAFVRDSVDLVRVIPTNAAIKRMPQTNIDVQLDEGEVLTVVTYSASGGIVAEERFIVRRGSAIAANEIANLYLTQVSLVSELISPSDATLLQNKLNVPFNRASLEANLHYNNGAIVKVPIDGNKVKLLGLDDFNESQLGSPTRLLLMYQPDAQEAAINMSSGNTNALVREYRLQNIKASSSFALKLFVIPVYNDLVSGYTLRYYVGNDEHTQWIEVTADVTTTKPNNDAFGATEYNSTQTLVATLRMDDVLPGVYPNHIHVQQFKLTLRVPTVGAGDAFVIDYIGDGSGTLGFATFANGSSASRQVHFRNDKLNLADWLADLYYEMEPIFDTTLLSAPIQPTHFRVKIDTYEADIPIDDWEEIITVPAGHNLVNFSTTTITWLFRPDSATPFRILGATPQLLKLS